MRRLWITLLLLVGAGGTARGGDAPSGDVPWPVAKAGAEAIYRAVLAFELAVEEKQGRVVLGLDLTTEHAQTVLGASVPPSFDVRVTQGRMWGEARLATGPRARSETIVQDVIESSEFKRESLGVLAPGGLLVRSVGAGVPPSPAPVIDDLPRAADGPVLSDLALPLPAAAAMVRVGTAWEGPLALIVPLIAPRIGSVRHTVSSVSADSVGVRSEGSLDGEAAVAKLALHVEFHLDRKYSRGTASSRRGSGVQDHRAAGSERGRHLHRALRAGSSNRQA